MLGPPAPYCGASDIDPKKQASEQYPLGHSDFLKARGIGGDGLGLAGGSRGRVRRLVLPPFPSFSEPLNLSTPHDTPLTPSYLGVGEFTNPTPSPKPHAGTAVVRAPKFQISVVARFSATVAFRSTRSTSRCPSESSDLRFHFIRNR